MRSKLMLLGFVVLLRASGCDQHPLTDYRPLDQAGMWSSNVEQLKTLNTSDAEDAQLLKLKQTGIIDNNCVILVTDTLQRHHLFAQTESGVNTDRAEYTLHTT